MTPFPEENVLWAAFVRTGGCPSPRGHVSLWGRHELQNKVSTQTWATKRQWESSGDQTGRYDKPATFVVVCILWAQSLVYNSADSAKFMCINEWLKFSQWRIGRTTSCGGQQQVISVDKIVIFVVVIVATVIENEYVDGGLMIHTQTLVQCWTLMTSRCHIKDVIGLIQTVTQYLPWRQDLFNNEKCDVT